MLADVNGIDASSKHQGKEFRLECQRYYHARLRSHVKLRATLRALQASSCLAFGVED